jgi:hypothetical protein
VPLVGPEPEVEPLVPEPLDPPLPEVLLPVVPLLRDAPLEVVLLEPLLVADPVPVPEAVPVVLGVVPEAVPVAAPEESMPFDWPRVPLFMQPAIAVDNTAAKTVTDDLNWCGFMMLMVWWVHAANYPDGRSRRATSAHCPIAGSPVPRRFL